MSTSNPAQEVKPERSYVLVMVVNVTIRGSKVAAQSFGDHLRNLVTDGGGADSATVVHIIEQADYERK